MSELSGIYALWYREFKVFLRERSRVISSIINPLLWFFIIGGGLGASITQGYPMGYQTFIYPGILIQTALFSSIFFGVYIVWDKKIDFMKEVLVAPMSRTAILIGKIFGGSTDTLIQIIILLGIGVGLSFTGFLHIQFTAFSLLASVIILFITTVGLCAIGLILGSQMESPEGFQLIISFLIFPMFFLSGALFPITGLPAYLAPFVYFNPVTYAVDGLRAILIGSKVARFNPWFDFMIISIFSIVMIFIGTYAFKKMKL